MGNIRNGRRPPLTATAGAALLALAAAPRAHAIGFQSGSGDWAGSFDFTVQYGQAIRTSGLDCRIVAIADGGCGYSPNIDAGDLNYQHEATFSQALRGNAEFGLNYKDAVGMFVRADGLYDFEVMDNTPNFIPLPSSSKDYVGSYGRLLDAFVYGRFYLGSWPAELRVGNQFLNWGESTFIPGGINNTNHFDLNALQVPGVELKSAFLPDEMVVFNLQPSKNLSTQLVYIANWHEDWLVPANSYFATNNTAVPGGSHSILGFGAISNFGTNFSSLGGPDITNFQFVPRFPDHTPPNSDQYGLNFKLYLPDFMQGTQLGFYFLNYTSRVPVVSVQTGTQAGFGNGWGAVNAVAGAAAALASGQQYAQAILIGTQAGVAAAASQGGTLSAATAQQYATIGAQTLLQGGNVNAQANNLATHEYAVTEGYFNEFPQDIKMLGISFNTQVQKTGTALQGEISYRHNVPLQLDDVQLLYASLTPLEAGVAKLLGEPVSTPGKCTPPPSPTPITGCNQLGAYGVGQYIRGYELKDVWQAQFTATQLWANVLGASEALFVLEVGGQFVPGLEDKFSGGPVGLGLQYDGPGTNVSGTPALGAYPEFPNVYDPGSAFPGRWSWGYVAFGHLEYDNVFFNWNVLPHIAWSQDVNGVSPGPGGPFLQGRHALGVGVSLNTRQRWEFDVSYTQYGGAGGYNLVNDRDFVSAYIKFSF